MKDPGGGAYLPSADADGRHLRSALFPQSYLVVQGPSAASFCIIEGRRKPNQTDQVPGTGFLASLLWLKSTEGL